MLWKLILLSNEMGFFICIFSMFTRMKKSPPKYVTMEYTWYITDEQMYQSVNGIHIFFCKLGLEKVEISP